MNGACILVWLGVATCTVAGAAEPAPSTGVPPAASSATVEAQGAAAEQWNYHEKWDKALQRGLLPSSKGTAPGIDCRPSTGLDKGTVRPSPMLPGRCPEPGSRVRT
jgi:hypothetical protein